MKIEAGKFYRTRGGEKVKVLFVASDELLLHQPVIGYIVDFITRGVNCWNLDGSCSCFINDLDLIAEWEEPKSELEFVDVPVVEEKQRGKNKQEE